MVTKIAKILADASLLAQKINSAVCDRENFLINHVSERVNGGSQPDFMHLSTTRDAHVEDVNSILLTFLKGLDLTEVLSDKGQDGTFSLSRSAGFPPVDESFLNVQGYPGGKRTFIVVGRKPDVMIFLKETNPAECVKQYLQRTGVTADDFLSNVSYEIMTFTLDCLVVNEVYRIPEEGFFIPARAAIVASAAELLGAATPVVRTQDEDSKSGEETEQSGFDYEATKQVSNVEGSRRPVVNGMSGDQALVDDHSDVDASRIRRKKSSKKKK